MSIRVRKYGSAQKFNANLKAISHECDVAVLDVAEAEFWEGTCVNPPQQSHSLSAVLV